MKKLSIILSLIMLITLFPSCTADDSKPDFEFFYEIEKNEYLRGEEIRIKASVKNISGRKLKYTGSSSNDYFPMAELYFLTDDGEYGGKIVFEPMMFTTDVVEKKIEKGEVGSYTYVFKIPADAVCGYYSLKLWRGDDSRVFENILRINAVTSQNENSEYEYSPISVSSGGETIKPIRMLVGGSVWHADGSGMVCDGMGAGKFMGKEHLLPTIPMLVCDGGISVEVPEYNEIQGVAIYDLKWERLNGYNNTSLRELDYLPAGDYIVVFSVRYDTKPRDPSEYERYDYDDLFRLTVPSKTAKKTEYNYSSVMIQSGNFDIRPIRCMLWVEEHKKGESLSGDGFGVSQIINNKEDHTDFPTLFYKGNLQVSPPVNVNLYTAKVQVYDTDYNELKFSFDRIEDIRDLLPGEYLIVFREVIDGSGCDPEITEYRVTCNECIFKFIVTESSIGGFAFDNIQKTYKPGDPGVKTSGFKNTSKQTVTNSAEAAERAKNECTIEYDTVTVLRDGWDYVWSVTFSTQGTLGGCQTVYLNDEGITLLIVYGE
ncbi:MAG: hypothetical protein IJY97_12590 [Clostridia bacterium]|nr:hypothetical protein [Clostridia bacterium]